MPLQVTLTYKRSAYPFLPNATVWTDAPITNFTITPNIYGSSTEGEEGEDSLENIGTTFTSIRATYKQHTSSGTYLFVIFLICILACSICLIMIFALRFKKSESTSQPVSPYVAFQNQNETINVEQTQATVGNTHRQHPLRGSCALSKPSWIIYFTSCRVRNQAECSGESQPNSSIGIIASSRCCSLKQF